MRLVQRLSTLTLSDADGAPVRLGTLWERRPVVLVFLRHFGCIFCREQVAQLRDRIHDIRRYGAELVIIGNGAATFAAAFREGMALECPLLVDPSLASYRAAGLRRGSAAILSPRLPLQAWRAWRSGARQAGVQGDPWQLGGVFVVQPGGALTFRYVSEAAGDHPAIDAVIAATREGAQPVAGDEPRPPGALARWLSGGLGRLVDPTIALSFDRTGFRIHSLAFDPTDLDVDLAGRCCLVTGANSGIGYEAALQLAHLGADVVLLCRSAARGEDAAQRIREATGNTNVSVEELDLASLASVRAAAARLLARPVDVLVHNAGMLPDRRIETEDHLEFTFATHVVGPFLLTQLLREALEASRDGRVVWVSSGGMYTQKLDLADVHWTARPYDGVKAYAETKRAQVVLSELWAEELRDTGVVVNAMHPGWADTPGVRTSLPGFHRIMEQLLRTPPEGADTIVWLAASARGREQSGAFFLDRIPRRTHFLPFTRETPDERRMLWALCERLSQA